MTKFRRAVETSLLATAGDVPRVEWDAAAEASRMDAYLMNPLPSLSKTLKASRISSSESVSLLCAHSSNASAPWKEELDGGRARRAHFPRHHREELCKVDLSVPVRIDCRNTSSSATAPRPAL